MFITVLIQAAISHDIENEIESILNDSCPETFQTECTINTTDISHLIKSNDGTTTILFKSQEESLVTYTPYQEILDALNRSGNTAD